jgi:hypothetical protein
MFINRIYCVGDGFAHGHIWPEWPQILQVMLPHLEIVVISGVGAGNEFLINGLLQHDVTDQAVIFQWAQCQRFDKIVIDQEWNLIAKQDPKYHFNFYQRNQDIWWLSSASDNKQIKLYHDFYIQKRQAQVRVQDYKALLHGYLESKRCRYVEISTDQQQQYSKLPRFASLRGNEVQPGPAVHYDFLIEEIIPTLGIEYDRNRSARLQQAILQTTWVAYDPDRDSIWQNIINQLDTDQ